jgi:hypothetical protein
VKAREEILQMERPMGHMMVNLDIQTTNGLPRKGNLVTRDPEQAGASRWTEEIQPLAFAVWLIR